MEILELVNSPKPDKRFRITMEINGTVKHYDFGAKNGLTFIDGATEQARINYHKRHLANKTERERIINYIPSPALFSFRLLWGNTNNLIDNLTELCEDFAGI
jgi:hypothetical protein